MLTSRSLISLSATAALVCVLSAQDKKPNLTARQLFYAAVQTSAPAAPEVKPEPPKVPSKPLAARSSKPAPKRTEMASTETSPVASTPSTPSKPVVGEAAAGPALGLRYTIMKVAGSGTMEVAPDTVFHAGDRIQLKVEANNAGYLYIINQGSSGTWKPIFPSPEIDNGNNRVESLHSYTLPSEDHRMVFDETVGSEKLFIILSRQPEPDLEKMIYSLQTKPAADRSDQQSSRQMIMAANIDNETVGRMRSTYARDLVIEKVTPSSPGERKETAVYVVNPTGSSSSRVVADLSLVHQ